MGKKRSVIPLSDKQLKVLDYLSRGWYLDRDGTQGLAGQLWIEGICGYRVSQHDMTTLFSAMFIEWDHGTGTFKMTKSGKYRLDLSRLPRGHELLKESRHAR